MTYNILIETSMGGYNIMEFEERKIPILIDYYTYGKDDFTIAGRKYVGKGLRKIKIYTNEKKILNISFKDYCIKHNLLIQNLIGDYFSEEALKKIGKDVTESFIGDNFFGYKKESFNNKNIKYFIDQNRIEQLKQLKNKKFDFIKLIKLCEEINDSYTNANYLSVGMIARTILHHVPPIFDLSSFDQVANNYGGSKEHKSFKKNMEHLNVSLKNIADGYLHTQIRENEILPNETQIDFKQDLDALLGEIVRISK